uniref:PAK1 interacting protein 1 n=1 Tax=Gouania willdenowi TaxID=441366 RepID=A0A8C5GS63_GOUWI
MAVIEMIAGSYEQITFGYRVKTDDKEWTPKPYFTHHGHTASISAVAASEKFVVTGSKDETIQLYNMKKRSEHGSLLKPSLCLDFYGSSHLLSGGEDGLLCVWSTKKWECLKSIKAHKGHVTSLSVHPSGKLALSVGTDKTLRTWNLINGRSAFIKNIKQNADIVRWSPDGDKYVVTASVTGTITNPKRISSVKFLNVRCVD